MTRLLVNLARAGIGWIMGDLNTGKTEGIGFGTIEFCIRCAYIFLQIFLAIGGLAFFLIAGMWVLGWMENLLSFGREFKVQY